LIFDLIKMIWFSTWTLCCFRFCYYFWLFWKEY